MTFGRRAFLQFTAGVVGGSLLTPLPWKLADDSAIWSQNWSWRPSPERGAITKKPSICVLCDGGCGIQARLVNENRAVLIEGNPDHPVNKGGVCPLGAAGLQYLYAAYRIDKPMKQTKKRGDITGFQPIGWSEAISELGSKLGGLRKDGKAATVACISSSRRSSMDELWLQFLGAYGSPNYFKMPSQVDSQILAASLATGQAAPIAFGLEKASYVLSFGANLIEGWGSPSRMLATYGDWHREASGKGAVRLVQIESRCSLTAAKADRWVPVAPGGEAALALAIAHVLIKDSLFDADFVGSSTFGFEDWTDAQGKSRQGFKSYVLSSCAPEQLAEKTGLDAAKIRELAKEFAAQKHALAVWAEGQSGSPGNIYHDLAFLALNVLKGNFKADGLVSLVPSVPLGSLPELLQRPTVKRLDLVQAKPAPFPGNSLHAFLDGAANKGGYPIEVLMVHEANPAFSLADSQVFDAAIKNVATLVSFSSYMDETAAQADIILPNHMAFERYDDAIGLPGAPFGYYAVAAPILKARLETKHTGEVLFELSKSLGGDVAAALPWKTYDAYLQERVKGLANAGKGTVADGKTSLASLQAGKEPQPNFKDGADLWKKLATGLCWVNAPIDPAASFNTTSGKYEFACQTLQQNGLVAEDDKVYLPHYAPLTPSGDDKSFPLLLASYRSVSIAADYLPNAPFLMKTLFDFVLTGDDALVQAHPQTARSIGAAEGDKIVIKTAQGEVTARMHLFPGARPGVLYLPQGLGHKAYDKYVIDKGINANRIMEVQMDPVTGLGTVWATRAQARRA